MAAAIDFFSNVGRFVFSSNQKPENEEAVAVNVFKFTAQTSLATGCTAIILAIVSRCLKKQGSGPALPSQLLNASLMIAATSAAVFIFSVYLCNAERSKKEADFRKVNRDIVRFERTAIVISLFGTIAAIVCTFLKKRIANEVFKSIATRSILPLAVMMATALLINFFHVHQRDRFKTAKRD